MKVPCKIQKWHKLWAMVLQFQLLVNHRKRRVPQLLWKLFQILQRKWNQLLLMMHWHQVQDNVAITKKRLIRQLRIARWIQMLRALNLIKRKKIAKWKRKMLNTIIGNIRREKRKRSTVTHLVMIVLVAMLQVVLCIISPRGCFRPLGVQEFHLTWI